MYVCQSNRKQLFDCLPSLPCCRCSSTRASLQKRVSLQKPRSPRSLSRPPEAGFLDQKITFHSKMLNIYFFLQLVNYSTLCHRFLAAGARQRGSHTGGGRRLRESCRLDRVLWSACRGAFNMMYISVPRFFSGCSRTPFGVTGIKHTVRYIVSSICLWL